MKKYFKKPKLFHIILIFLIFVFYSLLSRQKTVRSVESQLISFDSLQSLKALANQVIFDLEVLKNQAQSFEKKASLVGQNNVKTKENGRPLDLILRSDKKFLIVEYTKVFFKPKFCNKTSEAIFNSELETCEYKNCFYTCDTKQATIANADAFIFHQRDLEAELQLTYNNHAENWLQNTNQFPEKLSLNGLRKNPGQIWILWNDEATLIDQNYNKISSFFNWTMSYKTDAEIYEGSYGFFKPNQVNEELIHEVRNDIYKQYKNRKNSILWFVSNCHTKRRIELALEISQYYPVNIYTTCEFSVDSNKMNYPHLKVHTIQKKDCPRDSKCEQDLLESNKYFLGFENRNCTDYVSEKMWRSLKKKIIPIVVQPNRDSYSRYQIPDGAYIHMQDFGFSTEALGRFLTSMNEDFDKYYSFLKWTNLYLRTYDNNEYIEPHRMCQMCKRLNTVTSNIFYKDLATFFNGNCYDQIL